jgi:hypothetical protein
MFSALDEMSTLQKAELAHLRESVDAGLFKLGLASERRPEEIRETLDDKFRGRLEERCAKHSCL